MLAVYSGGVMLRFIFILVFLLASFVCGHDAHAKPGAAAIASAYFPERFDWQRRAAADVGMDATAIDDALRLVATLENPAPKDQVLALAQSFGSKEPDFGGLIGPTKSRAAINGLIVRRGYVVAEWGDTKSVDMSHSVSKTFLSTVVGLAWQQGLIRDVNDRAAIYMPPDITLFDSSHNQPITWDHLLRQTSDWQGTLWGKPDWADRPEVNPEGKPDDWQNRKLYTPGTRYKYNMCASMCWRSRHCKYGDDRYRKYCANKSWIQSAHPILGAGMATIIHGSSWMAAGCNRYRAAAIGAAACLSTRGTWRALAIYFCATVSGKIGN